MQQEDQRIAYEIERMLGQLPGIQIRDLQVSVTDGQARIQGVVPTLDDKQAALEAAVHVSGVVGVIEAIAVETQQIRSDRDHDESLGTALDDEEEVDVARVGAVARSGTARLVGEASSISELTRAASTAEGVRGTVNTLDSARIENPHGTDRIDLANAVADAFSRDPVLRLRSIRPELEDTGKLVITGNVRSPGERLRALEVAAEVPGVHTVREELQVIP